MNHHIGKQKRVVRSVFAAFLITVVSLLPLPQLHNVVLARVRGQSGNASLPARLGQDARSRQDTTISSSSATAAAGGVLLQWRTNSAAGNLRFRVYRISTTRRTFEELSIGTLSSVAQADRFNAAYLYRWFDPNGTADSVYYLESINLSDRNNVHDAVIPVSSSDQPNFPQASASGSMGSVRGPASANEYPESLSGFDSPSPNAPIDTQWGVAAQNALKIQIKSDGWYRVTQQQMAAAGFSPTVDVRNLSLFGDGQELAIRTSKSSGQLVSGDYIEFYGRGLDTLDTDTRIYYLVAGSSAGKRAQGDLHADGDPLPAPSPSQLPTPQTAVQPDPFGIDGTYRGLFAPLVSFVTGDETTNKRNGETKPATGPPDSSLPEILRSTDTAKPKDQSSASNSNARSEEPAKVEPDAAPLPAKPIASVAAPPPLPAKSDRKNKKKITTSRRHSRRSVRRPRPRYSHALDQATAALLSFNDTLQIKERFNYNTQLTNGHNFFGPTIGTTFPLTKTLAIHNIQTSADGPARLEVALQGLSLQGHQVNILFNNVLIGTMTNFFGHDNVTQTFTIPVSQLIEGDNSIKIAPVPGGEFLGLDHINLTYPHSYRAFNDSLRFSLRSNQSLNVDGFATPNVRLIDISDPTTIRVTRPIVAPSGGGYTLTIPSGPRAKAARSMYALPEGQFQTPAGFSLNQPSTLNHVSNGADLLIIAYKDFIPHLAPLVTQRQNQGLTVLVADIEDVFDEFSFGAHSSQAVQDFLSYASSHWANPPHYVLLGADASYDSRSHQAIAMVRAGGGCTDTNNNAADFGFSFFGNAHNSGFHSATPCSGPSGVVISQIYTGLGEKGASYSNSFIELYNRGSAPVNVNGWSVQYTSATGASWQVTNLTNITIQPGNYYLVQEAGFGGIFAIPTPDAIGNISMSFTGGKLALVNTTTPLTGSCPAGGAIIDSVGYGSATNCFEGSGPVPVSGDFVPTLQVDTSFGVACSDDSLADFNNDGLPEIPVGRLPARTPAEADLMVSKIVNFSKANVPQNALLVADAQGTYYWNFESHSDDLGNLLPQNMPKQKIYLAQQTSPAACEANIISAINQGVALVNYQGHGNINVWSGSSIFTNSDAEALTNGNKLPLFIVADCLNGLFDDPVLEGLGETLLKAPNGGAVAAYASSGETIPDGQQDMSLRVFQLLFGPQSMALGDVTKQAKIATSDLDVRRTWILLGDPSMKIF